jgi:predicted metal-binding membrane protein
MNLAVIVGLTAFLLIEKLTPRAVRSGRVSGALLVAAGLYVAAGL